MRSRNSGPRSNAWSRNKLTNQTSFDPQDEEISRVIEKYFDDYWDADTPIVRRMPLHPDFIMPVTTAEITSLLNSIPQHFVDGLRGVFLLGGSKKQAKSWSTFAYGRYCGDKIYLHPYPKDRMVKRYYSPPRPHELIEYKRAGAVLSEKPGEFVVEFTEDSLRQFYLRDVFMHEIGHHVDRANFGKKPKLREEGFAEWFATEYGFRLSK